jgi:4-amino-4-deoxy-L-arabinose transferase-like glycosyltransferase
MQVEESGTSFEPLLCEDLQEELSLLLKTPPATYLSQMSADISQRNRYLLLAVLFLVSVVALSQGIGEVTGVTAKDEYHLALRTPLFMMEHDEWIIPRLDGVPREKPPMVSWLTRASFEVFGISLTSARMINVLFAALLVLGVALISLEYTENLRYSLLAGVIALSTAGVAIQSKFLLYDIPTATFSAFAFYWFLRWCKIPRISYLVGLSISLSAGFLTKGPIGFVVFGSGVLALLITNHEVRTVIWNRKGALIGTLLLVFGLTAPWFVYAYMSYPSQSLSILKQEIAGRNIGDVTMMPMIGAAIIAFPWTFMLIHVLVYPKSFPSDLPDDRNWRRMFILWLVLSILPFFFIKTFIRYLIGSVIPIALLCASTIESRNQRAVQMHSRLGMIITSFLALFFAGFAWWFKTSMTEVVIVLVAWGVFVVAWWRATQHFVMGLALAVLWMTLIGLLYPTLGINGMPPKILREVEGKAVILYGDQQPGLLPIKMGRSLKVTPRVNRSDVSNEGRPPVIFAKEEDAADLEDNLRALGVDFEQVDKYKTLSSRVSWVRFTRKGATWNDWILAARNRSLEPIKLTIVLYDVKVDAGHDPDIATK